MRKNYTQIILGLIFLMGAFTVQAQDITLTFKNAKVTNDGTNDFYEADIYIASTSNFKLGDGQLYFNYNTAAFGTNISANGGLTFSHGVSGHAGTYILNETVSNGGAAPIYGNFVQNDNTTSRVSISWGHTFGTSSIVANNVTSQPKALLHIKMKYTDQSKAANICFESAVPFDDLFFTACGDGGFPFSPSNCTSTAGSQIVNDAFDCSASAPVSLSIDNELEEQTQISAYPNPVQTSFKIAGLTKKATAALYTIHGKHVFTKEIDSNSVIDMNHLPSGLYVVKVGNGKVYKSLKVMKR